MFGTLVNTAAILAGSFLGLLIKGGLKEKYTSIITQGIGLAVIFVGASGTLAKMFEPEAESILFIISLIIGGVLGEWVGIENRLANLGDWIQSKIKVKNELGSISNGFVSASLLFCVGTMAILGPLESGLQGDHTILFAKSTLDGIMAIVMASTLGVGVVFSAASVLIYQGLITLLAMWISPWLTADMLRELSIVGGILIAAIGVNMLEITKIRVGNLLPGVFVPIVWYALVGLFS